MAPLFTNSISHFMHPPHKLNHLNTTTPYICDGCKVPGTGSRFTCTICDFDLHDCCAKCPTRVTSPTHHDHPMSLVVHKPKPKTNYETETCPICVNMIEGLAYHCKDCSFWIHPLCSVLTMPTNSLRSDQSRAVPSASASFTQRQSRVEQVGIGLGTNWIYDQISGDSSDSGGFLESILSNFFSSS